ncbi:high-affinity choline transporter 1-like isoform X1 [Dermacentor albipictus]|uniref:high-affinity choline transporter 1-like isoform X1 n=1 Tax=Dermacentor albipictus TaxID=60249 RepID=UPI0031FD093B
MAVQIPAVLAMLFYLIAIMCVGVWSGRKLHIFKEDGQASTSDLRRRRPQQTRFLHRLFLADRNMSLTLGITSMTAIWVGGGYLNGTAEAVYSHGILYCHAPIGYAISLILGGFFFAQKMRTTNAVTMLDPFQELYGRWMGLLLCLPAVCGEVLWTAAMLSALGDTAGAMMEVDSQLFIILAATTIFCYTALGGHYSITYTDVLQLCTTAVFLWMCVPYVLKGRGVGTVSGPQTDLLGHIPMANAGQLFDAFLMTALGGIPWQVYFQCILGCKSDFAAQVLSYVAAIGCVFMALPPMIIGAAAKTTNFTAAGYPGPWQLSDKSSVLPQSIRYLTTPVVSILGMLGITAAVMSSADSSMFSASAMVTKNVYNVLIRPDASESEVAFILRIAVCLIGASATYLALSVHSVFELWTLCSDVVYVLLFPQFVCIFYLKDTNTYGSIIAFVLGAFSRWLCGEPSVSPTTPVHAPPHGTVWGQLFPYRLACMMLGLSALVIGSLVSTMAFKRHWLPPHCDVFGCFSAPHRGAGGRRESKLWIRPEVAEYEQTIKTGAECARSELTNRNERSQMPAEGSRATNVAVSEMTGKSQRTTGLNGRRKSKAAAVSIRSPETTNRGGHVGKQRQLHARKGSNETQMTVKDA